MAQAKWFENVPGAREGAPRLFCFPYAGGSAQIFRNWQRQFSPEITLSLAHLPGRAMRIGELPFRSMKPLVEALAQAMSTELQGAFAFWGHSMGALISFELARELRRRGLRGPEALFVSGHGAPQIPDTDPPMFNLPEEEFVAKLSRFNGTPKELLDNPELARLFLPTIRADFEVVETYIYEPDEPLACPIHAYGGLEDPSVPAEHLKAWQLQTSGPCKVRMFPGHHFFIQTCAADVINMLRRDALNHLVYANCGPGNR